MLLKSGHKVLISEEEDERQKKLFGAYQDGVVMLQPGGWFFTKPFTKYANAIYDFKFRPSDLLIVTYPKCGTTWLQEIIWTMRNNKNLNNPVASVAINTRCPFLEFDFISSTSNCPPPSTNPDLMKIFKTMCPGKDPEDGIFLQLAGATPEPRTIKTHVPFSLLPKNLLDTCNVVYMARNPKDVAVSFHHHSCILKPHDFKGSFDEFVDLFVEDKMIFSPFFTHIKEALDRKNSRKLHICYYEDFKKNPIEEYQKLNEFMNLKLNSQQVKNIVEYTSFEAMKSRDSLVTGAKEEEPKEEGAEEKENPFFNTDLIEKAGGFFRKGQAGDWKSKLTPEQEKKIDDWTQEKTKGLDLRIRYGV